MMYLFVEFYDVQSLFDRLNVVNGGDVFFQFIQQIFFYVFFKFVDLVVVVVYFLRIFGFYEVLIIVMIGLVFFIVVNYFMGLFCFSMKDCQEKCLEEGFVCVDGFCSWYIVVVFNRILYECN